LLHHLQCLVSMVLSPYLMVSFTCPIHYTYHRLLLACRQHKSGNFLEIVWNGENPRRKPSRDKSIGARENRQKSGLTTNCAIRSMGRHMNRTA
jgi:hypothetical protein